MLGDIREYLCCMALCIKLDVRSMMDLFLLRIKKINLSVEDKDLKLWFKLVAN